MAIDKVLIEEFINDNPLRQRAAAVLQHAGFTVAHVREETNGAIWLYHLKPNKKFQEIFGISREILFLAGQFSEFQARTVKRAAQHIEQSRPRLSEEVAIVVTHDSKTRERALESAETLDTIFLGFSFEDLKMFTPSGSHSFVDELQRQLYARDLYDVPTAVTRPSDFFGRREMITEMATRLRDGGKHIGLFGLRKIGKTSLLYRLQSSLRNSGAVYLAHVDIERIDAINPTAEYLLWSLGESIYDSHRHVRRTSNLALLGKHRLFSSIPDKSSIFETFDHDFRAILTNTKNPVVLMFDEIELLSPNTPGSEWGRSFVRVWRLLRGLDQQFPNRVSFFVTGTNPKAFEDNSIGGQENPVYNYFSVQYLKPLTKFDVEKLLTTLGNRMGLSWQQEAINRVFKATGGHPALVRSLASIARRLADIHHCRAIENDTVEDSIRAFFNERSSLLSQIATVLEEQYEDEYSLLELLSSGRIGEFREYADAFPSDIAHLLGYGLCIDPRHCTRLEIELLQTFIQRRSQRDVASNTTRALPANSKVGEYRIIAAVGNPGGFSQVYQAERENNETVAVKVFHNALLSALQRELEPLQETTHPNVVKVLDYGKTDDGHVFMATEYLDGGSLRSYCTASTKADESQVVIWLKQLLSALSAIHPSEQKIMQLRDFEELTIEQLAELEEARHGFVHRDIKPENVMICARGAVLIDFNISSRAAAPVMTQSKTPGYHPPDGVGVSWTPDVDLYQLGVTMLQVSLGTEYAGDNVEDLRNLASETLSRDLSTVLLKMTASSKEERFRSAYECLKIVDRLSAGEPKPSQQG